MIRIWRYMRGYCRVRICGASPDWMLNQLSKTRIPFWDITWEDPFTVLVSVLKKDLGGLEIIAARSMCQLTQTKQYGIHIKIRSVWRRPFLWVPVILCIAAVFYAQQHMLFFSVEGNSAVPQDLILRELESIGVRTGTYGPGIQTQWVEDQILNKLNELQWITINQNGCKARVIVRERPVKPEVRDRKGFANIVSIRPCVILSQSVWSGQALKEPGDVVLEGEMLVSGVVDLEKTYLLTYAQAEIYGKTWWNTDAVIPAETMRKGTVEEESVCIWLEIGKRRIKIFGNSGISTAVCDKMISRKRLSLPGRNELPISVCMETYTRRSISQTPMNEMWAGVLLSDAVTGNVMSQMIAGEVLNRNETLIEQNRLWRLTVSMECREMVARVAEANWIEKE